MEFSARIAKAADEALEINELEPPIRQAMVDMANFARWSLIASFGKNQRDMERISIEERAADHRYM